jgi:hypothetical protein
MKGVAPDATSSYIHNVRIIHVHRHVVPINHLTHILAPIQNEFRIVEINLSQGLPYELNRLDMP